MRNAASLALCASLACLLAACGPRPGGAEAPETPDEPTTDAPLVARAKVRPIPPPVRPPFEVNRDLLLAEFALTPTVSAEAQKACPTPETPTVDKLTDLLACRGGDQIVVDLSLGRRLALVRTLLASGQSGGAVLAAIREWARELDAANPASAVPEAPIARLVLAYAMLTANADPDALTWARPAINLWQADPETRVLAARMWASALVSCTRAGAPGICGVPSSFRTELKMHLAVARRLGGQAVTPEVTAIRGAIGGDAETLATLGVEADPPPAEPPAIASKRRRQEVRRVGLASDSEVLKVFIDPVEGLLTVGHMDTNRRGAATVRLVMPDQFTESLFEVLKAHFAKAQRAVCETEGRACAAPAQGADFGTEFRFVSRDGRVYLQRLVYYAGR